MLPLWAVITRGDQVSDVVPLAPVLPDRHRVSLIGGFGDGL